MDEILGIIIGAVVAWLNFVLIDTYFGLGEAPGVKGAENVGRAIKKRGGDLAGGFFQGNIVCSPDASAGTLLAGIGVVLMGWQGGLVAALLVYIGNRLCSDPGYAGTIGAITATIFVVLLLFIGISPKLFVVGMVIAILTIQGISQPAASRLLGKIAKKMNRHTEME